mgnify:CR=1 FL=1|tara:strand:- start:124 stop:3741 length:3618 start_codon:yes stop_codon:yes gene_type:complete
MDGIEDCWPQTAILPILHAHAGQSILIRVYRNGCVKRKGFHVEAYDVPSARPDINRKFRGHNESGWWLHWIVGLASEGGTPLLQDGDELRVFPGDHVKPRRRAQRFRSGVTHCVFTPMRTWAQGKLDGVTGKRQDKWRYNGYLRILDEYERLYADGVPEEAFGTLVNALGKFVHTHIVIELPLQGGALVDVRSKEVHGRTFKFMNTRLNHVDLNEVTCAESTTLERGALEELVNDLDEHGQFYTFQRSRDGISSVSTLQGSYQLASEYVEAVRQFENTFQICEMKIDAVRDPEVSKFVLRGMHYNITGLACNGELPDVLRRMRDTRIQYVNLKRWNRTWLASSTADSIARAKVEMDAACETAQETYMCIDIAKSYANFQDSVYYEGLPTKLTDLRPTSELQGPGFYLIDELDWHAADPKIVTIHALLGHPYRNLNVYTRPELHYLQFFGVTFRILEGCWADGHIASTGDTLVFPGEPKNTETDAEATGFYRKDERGVPFYARWVGACNQIGTHKTFWMKAERAYVDNLAVHLPEGCRVRYYEDGAAQFEYERKSAPHLTHFTAYINAYERLKMIEQLRCMDTSKVVWIDKDDITCKRHEFVVAPYMREKSVENKAFSNYPVNCYVSNIWQFDELEDPIPRLKTPPPTRAGGVVACLGVGGGGKTHVNLTDPGLRGVLYVPPSHDLLEAKRQEYGICGRVRDAALSDNLETFQAVCRYNVIVWDEVSEWWTHTLDYALSTYPFHKHILCGDPGFQLPPIKPANETRALEPLTTHALEKRGIPIFRFDYSHRIKCDALRAVCNELRAMIEDGFTEGQMGEYVLAVMHARGHVMTFDECKASFEIQDAILVSRTSAPFNFIEEYTAPLKERVFMEEDVRVRRYRVLKNAPLPNGRIVIAAEPPFKHCVEQYASSVHAYQGKTSKHKTYIDNRRMFEVQHWYTAFSRAEYLSNVFLVDVASPPPDPIKFGKTFIYRISSPNTPLVYIGHATTTLERRLRGHKHEFADASRKKRCTSFEVLTHGEARIELIERYPCASLQEAKARERFWIERTPRCVNKNIPGRTREEYNERAQASAPLPPRAVEAPADATAAAAEAPMTPPPKRFKPITSEEKEAWARGYRTSAEDGVLLESYKRDKEAGWMRPGLYWQLEQNPKQYCEGPRNLNYFWFADGVPNMPRFLPLFRRFGNERYYIYVDPVWMLCDGAKYGF